jgi:glycosyltransferase involved in cell wall biosynthesis
MRFAALGFVSDSAGSSAGAMTLMLRTLLELGHAVHFFGIPGFSEAPSLAELPRYRYTALRLNAVERGWEPVRRVSNPLPGAAYGQFAHLAYQREAIRRIESASRTDPFDVVLCADTLALWPTKLPLLSWPQSAPQTEWAALRSPAIRRPVRNGTGVVQHASVEVFYAFRWLQARVAWRASDMILCGSRWSLEAWQRFGVPSTRVRTLPYPLDLGPFTELPPRKHSRHVSFLWLGRAVPRKRFDLFLAAFERLARERSDVSALVVGNLAPDPLAERALAESSARDRIERRQAVPRAEIPDVLAEADVLVQPSESENFGFSLAEALAAGRPVVAGPTNGTGDYAGSALFRFSAYVPDAIASAMARAADAVLNDPERVAREARSAARELDSRRIAEQFVALCEQVVASKASRRAR